MRYRWCDTEEHEDEYGQPLSRAAHDPTLQPPPAEGLTKGGATGCVLAAGILLYGLVTWDTPLSLFSLSFLMYMLRPLVRQHGGAYGESLSHAMYGFSLAAGCGALLLAYL